MDTRFTTPLNTNIIAGRYVAPPAPEVPALLRTAGMILTASGSSVTLRACGAPESLFCADLKSVPLCAEKSGDTIYVMTAEGCHRIIAGESGFIHLPPHRQLPPVSFSADRKGVVRLLTISVKSSSGVSLSDGISPVSTLHKKLTAGLDYVYRELQASVSDASLFMQPVLVRCRFVDSSGATLMLTPPQLLGTDPLWQCHAVHTASVTKRSDTDFTINPFTLTAVAWQPAVSLPPSTHPSMQGVEAVRIEISSPVDFYDPAQPVAIRIARPRDNSPECHAYLSGADYGSDRKLRAKVESMTGTDAVFEVARTVALRPVVQRVLIKQPRRNAASSGGVAQAQPLNFSAGCSVRSGDTVAWGNITQLPFTPPHPAQILASGEERFDCTVGFYTHSGLLCSASGTVSGASRSFVHEFSCPDPEVCAVKVTFADTGASISASMTPCGGAAVAWHDSGEVTDLPDAVAASVRVSRCVSIVSALAADPLVPVSRVDACDGDITGLVPACRSQSSWDFSRTHLIALSLSGIHAVCFNSRAGYVSSTLIDRRSAPAGGIFAPDAVYVPVLGGVVRVTGARSCGYIPLPFEARRLAYREPQQLVLCRGESDEALWIAPDGELALVGAQGRIAFNSEVTLPKSTAPRYLTVPLLADSFSGKLTLLGDCGDSSVPALCHRCADIVGSVTEPLRIRVASRPRKMRAIVSLVGSASPDFAINRPFIS